MEVVEFKNRIWDLHRSISENMVGVFVPVVEQYGLTMMQLRILLAVRESREHTVGSIGRTVRVAGGNASSMCKRLEHDGFIARVRDNRDERIVRLHLTEKGEKALDEIGWTLEERYASALHGESAEELARTIDALEHLDQLLVRMQKLA